MNTGTISLAAKDNVTITAKLVTPDRAIKAALFILPDQGKALEAFDSLTEKIANEGVMSYSLQSRGYSHEDKKIKHQDIIDLMTEDLEVIMASCRSAHIDIPFILLGEGLGGHIALYYMLQRKVKELSYSILIDPWLDFKVSPSNKLTAFFNRKVKVKGITSDHLDTAMVRSLKKSIPFVSKEIDRYIFNEHCLIISRQTIGQSWHHQNTNINVIENISEVDSTVISHILST